MRLAELTEYLASHDVTLFVSGSDLRYRGSASALTPDVLNAMAEHKAALMRLYQTEPDAPDGDAGAVSDWAPLSPHQESIWFLHQLHRGNPADHLSLAFRVEGALDADRLEASLGSLVDRHSVLRSVYRQGATGPEQRVQTSAGSIVTVTDLSSLRGARREEAARELAAEFVAAPFDLEHDPVLRVRVLRFASTEWVVVFVAHHIAFDGSSFQILFDEVEHLYGSSDPLPDLRVQYGDVVRAQRAVTSEEEVASQLDYWLNHLDSTTELELPTDRPRQPVQGPRGARHAISVPPELRKGIQELGRQEGGTLFMTLSAAVQTLLFRYTGQTQISIGTPVSLRERPEDHQLIGLFLNMVVIQSAVDPAETYRERVRRVRAAATAAYANRSVPFEKLVSMMQPDRDLSRNPLFQVMLQLSRRANLHLPGLTTTAFEFERRTSQFDLSFHFYEELDGSLTGYIEYDTDLFDSDRISRMAGHLSVLLNAALASPDAAIGELDLLTSAEREQLIYEWNANHAALPAEQTISALVASQVERDPQAPAVVHGDDAVDYATLAQRAEDLSRRLISVGVGPNTVVAVHLPRSVDMVVAILGVLKAGGAYLPLDPGFPEERLSFMMKDSEAPVLITAGTPQPAFVPDGVSIIEVSSGASDPPRVGLRPAREPEPSDLAYVIYTSGSTGKPKGVMIPHRAVINFVTAMSRQPGMTNRDRIVAVTTLSFDIHVLELLQPLTVGATVIVAASETAADGYALAMLLEGSRATMMQATPSTWRLLAESGWKGNSGFKALCGGEALPAVLAEDLVGRTGELWNMYGPTETTVWSTCARFESGDEVTIGRPIANTELYVLDPRLQAVPVGVPGELHIGGVGVSDGYLGRPELTEERFIPNPFGAGGSKRLYKTGDLVVYRSDGSLQYLRRLDDQVKIRGFRIELGEIDTAMGAHPDVSQCSTVVRDIAPGDERLISYFTTTSSAPIAVDGLRSFLSTSLPEYMVPSLFVQLDALPLTPNGKVDKTALPQPSGSRPTMESSYLAPEGEAQETIVEIWRDILNLDRVGVEDNFFDLGGHSLLLIQLRSRLERSFETTLALADLFRNPTVRGTAALLSSSERRATNSASRQGSGEVPLTPNLCRFLIERGSPKVDRWNVSALLTLPDDVDLARLRAAARYLPVHHDALRLRFSDVAGSWRQWFDEEPTALEIDDFDLTDADSAQQLEELATITDDLHDSLRLSTGPLLRLAHFDLGIRGRRLFVVVHHLVGEGMSLNLLLSDLATAYAQLGRGEEVALPDAPMSVQEWSELQLDQARSAEVEEQLDYWLSLPWKTGVQIPSDRSGGPDDNTNESVRSETVTLAQLETARLLHDRPAGATAEEILLASLVSAVANGSGRMVHLERLGHGRIDQDLKADLTRTVGFFLSYTPMLLEFREDDDRVAALEAVVDQIRSFMARGTSFDLLKWMHPGDEVRNAMRAIPKPQLSFNFRGHVDRWLPPGSLLEVAPENEVTASGHDPAGLRYYPLAVVSDVHDEHLTTRFVFSSALFSQETIQNLAERFGEQLRALIELPTG